MMVERERVVLDSLWLVGLPMCQGRKGINRSKFAGLFRNWAGVKNLFMLSSGKQAFPRSGLRSLSPMSGKLKLRNVKLTEEKLLLALPLLEAVV